MVNEHPLVVVPYHQYLLPDAVEAAMVRAVGAGELHRLIRLEQRLTKRPQDVVLAEHCHLLHVAVASCIWGSLLLVLLPQPLLVVRH
jgi:hypothetical protein